MMHNSMHSQRTANKFARGRTWHAAHRATNVFSSLMLGAGIGAVVAMRDSFVGARVL